MKYLNLDDIERKDDYLIIKNKGIDIVFSTAEEGKNFNRNTEDGRETLKSLIEEFAVEEVQYLKQIHSSDVFIYKSGDKSFIENEGDAIITKEKGVIIGAFTADCVPVIIVDEKTNTIAAIHSGWKGTYNSITKKTLEKMRDEFNVKLEDVKVYIGAHIRQCCYEVSEELKEKFIEKTKIKDEDLFKGRNLSMEKCIEQDILSCGVSEENIYSLNLCTHCEKRIKLHSYRGTNGSYGRLFSFVYIK